MTLRTENELEENPDLMHSNEGVQDIRMFFFLIFFFSFWGNDFRYVGFVTVWECVCARYSYITPVFVVFFLN